MIDYEFSNDISNASILLAFEINKSFDIDYFYFLDQSENVLSEILEEIKNQNLESDRIEQKIFTEVNFSNLANTVNVKQDVSGFKVEISALNFIFDMNGGYRKLVTQTVIVPHENVCFLSNSSTEYSEVDLTIKGTGENVYLWVERYDAERTKLRKNTIGINYGGWQTTFSVFELSKNLDINKNWFPKKTNLKSPVSEYLKPFLIK